MTVEVHLASGLPSFTLVGLPDTEVKEARDRVRAAHRQFRLRISRQAHHGQPGAGRPAQGIRPLRPADRARHPGRQRPDSTRRRSTDYEFAGELSLSGELRPVRGALAMALQTAGTGKTFILPDRQRPRSGADRQRKRPGGALPARSVRSPERTGIAAGDRLRLTSKISRFSRTSAKCAARARPSGRWKSPPPATTRC